MSEESRAARSSIDPKGSSEFQIGLWGGVGSGKAQYLAALPRDPNLDDNLRLEPQDRETRSFLDSVSREICQHGRPVSPDPEIPNADGWAVLRFKPLRTVPRPRKWLPTLVPPCSSTATFAFRTLDAQGSWNFLHNYKRSYYSYYMKAVYQQEQGVDPVTWLVASQGMVYLLNAEAMLGQPPETPGENRDSDVWQTSDELHLALSELFDILREESSTWKDEFGEDTGCIRPVVAFCLSKIDLPGAYCYRGMPEARVRECLPQVHDLVASKCHPDRRQWFAISSLGATPYKLLKPIQWLASCLTGESVWLG